MARERFRIRTIGGARAGDRDEDLLLAVGRGEWEAFQTLYRRLRERVWRRALRMTSGRADAEAVFEETFRWLFRRAFTWRPGDVLDTRLHRAMRRIAGNLGGQDVHRPLHFESGDGSTERFAAALRCVPATHREVLGLRLEEGMPVERIVRITGLPESTVRTRLRMGLMMIRALTAGTPAEVVDRTEEAS